MTTVEFSSIETLRFRFFGISREPQTLRSHVIKGLRITFIPLDHAPEVSDLPQGFLHPKTSQPHVYKEIRLFRTLLLIDYRFLFQENVVLKTISQLK